MFDVTIKQSKKTIVLWTIHCRRDNRFCTFVCVGSLRCKTTKDGVDASSNNAGSDRDCDVADDKDAANMVAWPISPQSWSEAWRGRSRWQLWQSTSLDQSVKKMQMHPKPPYLYSMSITLAQLLVAHWRSVDRGNRVLHHWKHPWSFELTIESWSQTGMRDSPCGMSWCFLRTMNAE